MWFTRRNINMPLYVLHTTLNMEFSYPEYYHTEPPSPKLLHCQFVIYQKVNDKQYDWVWYGKCQTDCDLVLVVGWKHFTRVCQRRLWVYRNTILCCLKFLCKHQYPINSYHTAHSVCVELVALCCRYFLLKQKVILSS